MGDSHGDSHGGQTQEIIMGHSHKDSHGGHPWDTAKGDRHETHSGTATGTATWKTMGCYHRAWPLVIAQGAATRNLQEPRGVGAPRSWKRPIGFSLEPVGEESEPNHTLNTAQRGWARTHWGPLAPTAEEKEDATAAPPCPFWLTPHLVSSPGHAISMPEAQGHNRRVSLPTHGALFQDLR